MLTTRDGAAVEPGTPLYWLEPGTTRVYEAETWTRDAAMQRWSSIDAALTGMIAVRSRLCGQAMRDRDEAQRRRVRHHDAIVDAGELRTGLRRGVPVPVTRVPPTDRPEAS